MYGAIFEAISVTISLVDNILSKLPDYDQRKKEHFYWLKGQYESQLKKSIEERDDDLIVSLGDELLRYGKTFAKELSTKS